ncbi:MAG: 50S ribosomal protein L4 [Limnothrix sp.]|uniref:Large ribosomal subunit protein uL4 n=1 Tax=Limnothrix redekei LRLZ20PSL1 TaxID=3112953 RepID=A0ABW7C6G4_9CYAN|nr:MULTISPECIES: 50S ribosomal protein L4 [unclassified Limnothrix]MEB3118968.1 50S ribosomal protein L4 [Limnothrix sp.]OCQ93781.1 50S ribosomal protein L4 [Limnothrix sp. P13C2]MBD2162511.1 50S ribosomal protein L4 [Limnothrix sp. FACHB-1083]MBD2193568.1 50S ribosomal protein L4 [Limnothrix sp. FACHB-1088]MBD2633936.1 50S ribosomal protein L4 [Limnothrix sp. FACHB-881]
MVNCIVKDWDGKEAGKTELDLRVAREENAQHIVHRALVRQLANARQGTVSTKTRSEVRGGGRKPWRQKGTGRARAGSNRSPLWRGGGVIFGPKPRDYSQKMNRKERRLALRTAFQGRLDDLVVVENFASQLSQPKTKDLLAALARWDVDANQKVLLIVADQDENVWLSARNVQSLRLILATNLNVFDLLNADKVVVTADALEKIKEVYGDD